MWSAGKSSRTSMTTTSSPAFDDETSMQVPDASGRQRLKWLQKMFMDLQLLHGLQVLPLGPPPKYKN
ncbi:hypothetical protein NL676_017316 [Syzygium grande]|nr:hypothetical protein NL676_017316 [Syzygium grande]